MGAGAGGTLGSATNAGGQGMMMGQKPPPPQMPGGPMNGMAGMTPGGARNMRPGQGFSAGMANPGKPPPPGGLPPATPGITPPPGGWGTAIAGAPPGGSAPMGGAPAQGWLQQALASQGGVKPAAPMPAQRQWAPPAATTPLEIGGKKNQGQGQVKPGMNFFQQPSAGWGRNSSGQRRYMGGSR